MVAYFNPETGVVFFPIGEDNTSVVIANTSANPVPITATSLPLPEGASTNDSDDKINLLIKLLLQKGAECPPWLDIILNALRVTVTSGSIAISSGTIGTLTNQSQMGGYSADQLTINAAETDWGITTRGLLI